MMPFGIADVAVALIVALGIWRGAKRGLAEELPRTVAFALFFFTGTGLLRWSNKLLLEASRFAGIASGLFGLLAIFIAAYFLARMLRRKMRDWALQKYPDPAAQRAGGVVAGGIRAFLMACTGILILNVLPFGFLTSGSVIGWLLLKVFLPVYRATH
jgi:hypothetical protein